MELKRKEDVIIQLSAREVWENDDTNRIEEQRMSPFIKDNIDEISSITGYELECVATEQFIGDFRADIVCRDVNTNEIVVIENQLGSSNHNHIGKALTYMANIDAKAVVWICENARDEHRKSIEWLNQNTPEGYNFYILELKFEKYHNGSTYYEFERAVVPGSINKIGISLKSNPTESSIEVEDFLQNFMSELRKDVPSAKYVPGYGRLYQPFCGNRKIRAKIGMSSRTGHMVFNINLNKDLVDDVEKYTEIMGRIKSCLAEYGYNFEMSSGGTNDRVLKLNYEVEFDRETEKDKIREICINIYNVIKTHVK